MLMATIAAVITHRSGSTVRGLNQAHRLPPIIGSTHRPVITHASRPPGSSKA